MVADEPLSGSIQFTFDRYRLDPASGRLFAAERPVRLRHKNIEVLLELTRRAGQLVTRDELLKAVWPDVNVQDETLTASIAELRRVFGETRKNPRFIETVHGKGFRFIADVEVRSAATGLPGGAPASVVPIRPCIGRDGELRALQTALDEARAGHGSLVLCSGDQGIGKTHLIQSFLSGIRDADAMALLGRCLEHDGAPALWPWIQIHRALAAMRPDGGAKGSPIRKLAEILASLESDRDRSLEERSSDVSQSPFRLFDAAALSLREVSREIPLVVVIEDLHRADETSLLLLEFVARELQDAAVLVVATYRSTELLASAELRQVMPRLLGSPRTVQVTVSPLVFEDIARLVQNVAGREMDAPFNERICRESAGNPFFAEHLVRHLLEGGWVDADGGVTKGGDPGTPESLRLIIEQRLSRLGESSRYLLSLAAVIGREFDVALLARLHAQETGESLRSSLDAALLAIDEAVAARIVEPEGALNSYRFTHALFRDGIYEGLGVSTRTRLHRSAGEALEAEPQARPLTRVTELAGHFFAGAAGEKAVTHCQRAGDQAAASFAYEGAVRQYTRALEALRLEEQPSRRTEAGLCVAIADAHWKLGNVPDCESNSRHAADLARELGDGVLLARAGLSYGHQTAAPRPEAGWTSFDESVQRTLQDALRMLPEGDSELRARVLSRLAWAHYYAHDPDERWLELGHAAVEMARRLGAPQTLFVVLHERHVGLMSPRFHDERYAIACELADLAKVYDDRNGLAFAHHMLGWDLLEAGHVSEADAAMAKFAALAEETREPWWLWSDRLWRSTRATMSGRFEEAQRLIEETHALGSRLKADVAAFAYQTQLIALRLTQTQISEVEGVLQVLSFLPAPRALFGYHLCEEGRVEEAQQVCAGMIDELCERPANDTTWLMVADILAQTYAAVGDRRSCERLYGLLLPFENLHVILGTQASVYSGSVSRALGRLAGELEIWDPADAHFAAAEQAHRTAGSDPWLAETQFEWSHMLRRRKRKGDAYRVAQLRRAARRTATRLSMPGLLRHLDATAN